MNVDSTYSNYGMYYDENTLESRKKKTLTKKYKIIVMLSFLLGFILLGEVIVYFLILPATSDISFKFTGLNNAHAAKMAHEVAERCGLKWFRFDTGLAASIITADGSIESVSVEKRFPDMVMIAVKKRVPVAVSLLNSNGKTIAVEIDKNGIVFNTDSVDSDKSVPLISGLMKTTDFEGMRLNSKFRNLIKNITVIQEKNPLYFSAISEIQVLPKSDDNFELALYPIHSKVRVLLDRNLDEQALQYMMVLLDVLNELDSNIIEVDLRYGAVSYKIEPSV